MTHQSDDSAPDEQRGEHSDEQDTPTSSVERAEKAAERQDEGAGGQVSESARMSTTATADGTLGTDDGVPPAEDAGTEPGGPPRPYGNGNHS